MLRKQSENTYDLLHGALRPSRRRSCCLRCAVTGTLKQAAPCSSANASSSADLSSLLDIRSALAECGSFYGNGHAWCHGRVSYSLSPGKTNAARLTVKEDFFFQTEDNHDELGPGDRPSPMLGNIFLSWALKPFIYMGFKPYDPPLVHSYKVYYIRDYRFSF
jgi:hypothetical protein